MRFTMISSLLAVILLAGGLASAKGSPEQKREKTRKMAGATLGDLYKLQPASRESIQKSLGYAVFNNMGTHLLLVSTARGAGVAVNSKTKQDTFMKMISVGAGLGMGVRGYRVIFVFETPQALANFLDSGWTAQDKQMPRPRQVSRAQRTRERLWLRRMCGCTRSPRRG